MADVLYLLNVCFQQALRLPGLQLLQKKGMCLQVATGHQLSVLILASESKGRATDLKDRILMQEPTQEQIAIPGKSLSRCIKLSSPEQGTRV